MRAPVLANKLSDMGWGHCLPNFAIRNSYEFTVWTPGPHPPGDHVAHWEFGWWFEAQDASRNAPSYMVFSESENKGLSLFKFSSEDKQISLSLCLWGFSEGFYMWRKTVDGYRGQWARCPADMAAHCGWTLLRLWVLTQMQMESLGASQRHSWLSQKQRKEQALETSIHWQKPS